MNKKHLVKELEDIEEYLTHIDATKGIKKLRKLISKLKGGEVK